MTGLDISYYGVSDGFTDVDYWNFGEMTYKKLIRNEASLLSWYTKRGIKSRNV